MKPNQNLDDELYGDDYDILVRTFELWLLDTLANPDEFLDNDESTDSLQYGIKAVDAFHYYLRQAMDERK